MKITNEITIIFKNELPLKIKKTKIQVRPTLLSMIRCSKCQMNGHTANKCRNNIRCLKCAGPHKIAECKANEITCVNCGQGHKTTYKACLAFQTYRNKIEKQNY